MQKRDRRSCDQRVLRRSTTELRRGVLLKSSCAGGTRTHDIRLITHVLQIGSRSCAVGDEVLARGFLSELLTSFRPPMGLEPMTSPHAARSHHVLRTGSRLGFGFFPCCKLKRSTKFVEPDVSMLYPLSYSVGFEPSLAGLEPATVA